ncbi:Putative NAD-dependent epimerase/dehydratase, NAD(P)-binding domain superfamily [Septoria linicola]|uniref:NAD-dependent epimerase/dehydratase, NAD(P)-binding domain superfamily n=1 Tax=Septoria linicola TaxID=215465 RepID=A0A9Q9AF69_9PEZI|nr:putative NAD-dependent epimerase/dehydratase, NAD(P)-binding domain superfamily [Septoria linicola]USW47990.1 Putative NAD-dependent epimerase/dehydratase, NAD(P)-binding domain superfamily [Septoria linicola]
MTANNKAIPVGSLVLVTGINGYIASHVADQLLKRGYRVRGTARSTEKLNAIVKTLKARTPGAVVEGVVIEDMQADGAFAQAVQDAAGVIHVASDLSLSPDPNKVIPATIAGLKNALDAAAASATVKKVVYTSSVVTLPQVKTGSPGQISASDWNAESVKQAWAPPPYEADRMLAVYGASKVESEQFAWKYVQEKKLHFVFNTVLPAIVCGPVLEGANKSSAAFIEGLHSGDQGSTDLIRRLLEMSTWHVDVEDTALLHVAALLEEDVKDERILAIGETCTYREVIEALKKIDPSKIDYAEPANEDRNIVAVDTSRTVEILKRYGRPGITSLVETLSKQLSNKVQV